MDLETWKILEKVDMAMIGMDIPLWNFMGTAHLKEKGFEVITPISGTNDFPARVGFEFAKNKEEAEKGNVTRVMVNTTFDTVLVADTLVSKIEEVSVN